MYGISSSTVVPYCSVRYDGVNLEGFHAYYNLFVHTVPCTGAIWNSPDDRDELTRKMHALHIASVEVT